MQREGNLQGCMVSVKSVYLRDICGIHQSELMKDVICWCYG